MTLGALRFAMAVVLLFFFKLKYAPEERIRKEDVPLLAGAGLTGVTIYFFFENNGVLLIPASEASIIVGVIPVITLIAEGLGDLIASRRKTGLKTGGKKPVPKKVILTGAGALISLLGVALVAGVSFVLSGTALGYVFMAGACVSWVCYCFLTRPLFAHRGRLYIVFWQSLIGFIGFLPFTFFENFRRLSGSGMSDLTMPGILVWGHVAFLGIFCSALGYLLYAELCNSSS
jgi:drug/metabolite transporter (DMT)-like permease